MTRGQGRGGGQPGRPPKSKKSSTEEPDNSDSLVSGSPTPTWPEVNSVEKVDNQKDSNERAASEDEDPFMQSAVELAAKTLAAMRQRDNATNRGNENQVGFTWLGRAGQSARLNIK